MSERSRVRIPVGVWGFLQNVHNVSGAHPTPYSTVPGFFPAGKAVREWRWPHTSTYCRG